MVACPQSSVAVAVLLRMQGEYLALLRTFARQHQYFFIARFKTSMRALLPTEASHGPVPKIALIQERLQGKNIVERNCTKVHEGH
jgi:hypothetical protein